MSYWRIAAALAAFSGAGFLAVSVALAFRLSAPVLGPMPPAPAGAEEVRFPSESGSEISGWYFPEGRCGAVSLMHHVRGNRTAMLERAALVQDLGYSALVFDFQGHGASQGSRITFGHLESLDAAAAVRFLRASRPGARIGAIGTSLGGAAALVGAEPLELDALVVEAVYPTLEAAVHNRISMRLGPLAHVLSPVLLLQMKPLLGFSASQLRPVDGIARLEYPVMVVGGSEDRHTPASETEALFAAGRDPKNLWMLEGAAHVDFFRSDPAEYKVRVGGFLQKWLGCPEAPGETL